MSLRPVVSGRRAEPGAVLPMDNSNRKRQTIEMHTQGTLLVEKASRVKVARLWKTSPRAESLSLGNVTSVEATLMLQECWFNYHGRPVAQFSASHGDSVGCDAMIGSWRFQESVVICGGFLVAKDARQGVPRNNLGRLRPWDVQACQSRNNDWSDWRPLDRDPVSVPRVHVLTKFSP